MATATPEEIRAFWFGPRLPASLDEMKATFGRFNASLDEELCARFLPAIEAAIAGDFEEWWGRPRDVLALILLLDQFPRHAFRGTARQYDGDARALSLALRVYDQGWDQRLEWVERVFIMMPLLHHEGLEVQRRCVSIADQIAAAAPPSAGFFAEIGPSQARKYLEVIEQFGRFPHRNEMLGRPSTPEELEFLKTWKDRAAPDALRERGMV